MNIKDVIAQAEKLKKEWHDYVELTDFDSFDIPKWWLSKFDIYTKDLLQSVVDTVKDIQDEYEQDEKAFNNGLQAMKGDVLKALSDIIQEIK